MGIRQLPKPVDSPHSFQSYGAWMFSCQLTHWGRVTHICVSKLTIIASDNGLSPGRRQAIIWTNDGILLIRALGTNFSEILSKIHSFSFKKMHLKMSSVKGRLFSLGLNELIWTSCRIAGDLRLHEAHGTSLECYNHTVLAPFWYFT